MKSVEIEPFREYGLVIRSTGFEQLWQGPRSVCFVPDRQAFHFPTIDAARDFCWACGFNWSVKATP